MAIQSPSSSSSFSYAFTYQVFLSFRGSDTRYGFTGNLYKALTDKGIHTFIDDNDLLRGDEITPSLVKAIEESRILFPYYLQTMHLLHFVWTNLSTSFTATRQRVVWFCLFSMVWILLTYDIRLEVTASILLSMKRSSKITRKTWRGWSNGRWL